MQRGRPIPKLILTAEERELCEGWGAAAKNASSLGVASPHHAGLRGGESYTTVSTALRLCKQTVGKCRGRFVAKRLDGLLEKPRPRSAASDQRRPGGTRDYSDPGIDPYECYALAHQADGSVLRDETERRQPHLAGLRLAAPSQRNP
jgi:hypothetical protein